MSMTVKDATAPGEVEQIPAGKIETGDRVWWSGKWRKVTSAVTDPNSRRIQVTTGFWWPHTWKVRTTVRVDVVRHKGVWR